MSLHLNQQCQRADALPPPVRMVPGIGCTDQEETRNERRPLRGRVRCWRRHIWVAPGVNRVFCNIVALAGPAVSRVRADASFKIGLGGALQGCKTPEITGLFRRSGYTRAWPRPRPRCAPSDTSPGRRSRRSRAAAAIGDRQMANPALGHQRQCRQHFVSGEAVIAGELITRVTAIRAVGAVVRRR